MKKSKLVLTNKKIEKAVVEGYKKIEDKVVGEYQKVEDRFVDRFLRKTGETVEDAKERLNKEQEKREKEKQNQMDKGKDFQKIHTEIYKKYNKFD